MVANSIDIPKESCALRIKKALSIRNMTQSELCQRTKIPKSALSEYIKGLYEPKQDRLILLSEALCVDPVWLMGFDVPMEKGDIKFSPDELVLTEGEKKLILLFRKLPADLQESYPVALEMHLKALGLL